MKNIVNKIKQAVKLSPLVLSLGSCKFSANIKNTDVDFAHYKEYPVQILKSDRLGREIMFYEKGHPEWENSLGTCLLYAEDKDNNGFFEEIKNYDSPQKEEIQKYANQDSLNKIFDYVSTYGGNENN